MPGFEDIKPVLGTHKNCHCRPWEMNKNTAPLKFFCKIFHLLRHILLVILAWIKVKRFCSSVLDILSSVLLRDQRLKEITVTVHFNHLRIIKKQADHLRMCN